MNGTEQLDITPIDNDQLTEHYAEANQETTEYRTPPPGSYALRMPLALPDDAFTLRTTKDGSKRYLEVLLDNGREGLAIVGGDFDGMQARFVRITTLMQRATKYNRREQRSEVITDAEGVEKMFSDTVDLLRNFNREAPIPQNKDESISAIRALEGLQIPSKVYLSWEARAKGTLVEGWPKRLYAKDFKAVDGTYAPYLELTSEVQFEQKRRGEAVTVNPGEQYRVYPNLSVGRRGFAARK